MWLNSTAQTALRAVLFIAEQGVGATVRVDDIAAALDCPRNYLSKTLHGLTREGVLKSFRGPKGGFQLAESPDHLPLSTVVGPFEPAGERRCLLGRASCSELRPCHAHHRWSEAANAVERFFGETTVADLVTSSSNMSAS